MQSVTGVTALDVYIAENNVRIVEIKDHPVTSEKTSLAKDTANEILKESPGKDRVYLVAGYEIISPLDLSLVIEANGETILSTDEPRKNFEEPLLIRPMKDIIIKESHKDSTIPLKVKLACTEYKFEVGRA